MKYYNKNQIFPAITLYQPWATWIIKGWKTIETRTHNRFACLKGRRILIHAGQKTDKDAMKNPYLRKDQIEETESSLVNGSILGSAFVWESIPLSKYHSKSALIDCSNTERFGLFLTNLEKFDKPIPVKGSMGIWYFDYNKKIKVKKP